MSKKTEFHNRLSRGMDADRAAVLSGITARRLKSQYHAEWKALQVEQAQEVTTPERSQFVQDFLALPPDLQYFYASTRELWDHWTDLDYLDDLDTGRQLQEMLEEWRLYLSQPRGVHLAWLQDPNPGSFAGWLSRYKPVLALPIPAVTRSTTQSELEAGTPQNDQKHRKSPPVINNLQTVKNDGHRQIGPNAPQCLPDRVEPVITDQELAAVKDPHGAPMTPSQDEINNMWNAYHARVREHQENQLASLRWQARDRTGEISDDE